MQIEFDSAKRQDTLEERGLDMADAAEVFERDHLTVKDARSDYGETRHITVWFLGTGWWFSPEPCATAPAASSA